MRDRPTGASNRSPRRPDAHGPRRPDGQRGAAAGPRVVGDRAVCIAGYSQLNRILDRARLNFLSWRSSYLGILDRARLNFLS